MRGSLTKLCIKIAFRMMIVAAESLESQPSGFFFLVEGL